MQVLLRDEKTGLFFQKPGVWTPRIEEAADFGNCLAAVGLVRQHRLSGVAIVLSFDDAHYNLILPLEGFRMRPPTEAGLV